MDVHNPGDRPQPRYTQRPFPPYRFLPGKNPHPRRDPHGHSYGQPEPVVGTVSPERWHEAQDYLYAVDLYNHGYWWESHEVFEALWHAAGHHTIEGKFYRALIQLAAASVKAAVGQHVPAQRLLQRGLQRLEQAPDQFMGLEVRSLLQTIRATLGIPKGIPEILRLHLPGPHAQF